MPRKGQKQSEQAKRLISKNRSVPVVHRFWQYVKKTKGCWEWIGLTVSVSPNTERARWEIKKYGRISVNGKKVLAHRVSYSLRFGEIPRGMQIDHVCNNTLCVNPEHLEVVTQSENTRRGLERKKRVSSTHS